MIEVSRQLNAAPKRAEKRMRKNEHADDIKKVYARGADLMPADYLTVDQEAEPERRFKMLALASQRRQVRNAKRLANSR